MIEEFLDHPEVGAYVRKSAEWTADVLRDTVSVERAELAFDTFVDPAEIDRVFDLARCAAAVSSGEVVASGVGEIRHDNFAADRWPSLVTGRGGVRGIALL